MSGHRHRKRTPVRSACAKYTRGIQQPGLGVQRRRDPSTLCDADRRRATWGVQYAPRNEKFVLIHCDLGPGNVMIGLTTLEFNAIIDWECAAFYSKWLAESFWTVDQKEHYGF
ncbi:hypothetical protein GGR55DRAFT_649562 [Xylaria sp. FL0064]|nr:hypothetical protein GGR55DRAFT_649562 [Xylaria sp. FL0064]